MSAYHAQRLTRRLGLLALFLMGGLVGCGDSATTPGKVATQDQNAGSRRKEMENYQKSQQSGGQSKPK
jgi:hypothetical protein